LICFGVNEQWRIESAAPISPKRERRNAPKRSFPSTKKDNHLAKPNYQHEKRQRDIAKKKKQEEKRQNKLKKKEIASNANPDPSPKN
jgi:hypothetical protein